MAESSAPGLADAIIQRNQALKGDRNVWDSWAQDVANYVMPRKANITSTQSQPSSAKEQALFDTTAARANQTLANGQLSWMTPHESPWFSFDPPPELQGDDEVKQWYQRCTAIAQTQLSQSDFYSEIHELYLDRGAFGTAVLYCQEGKKNALHFENLPVGTFSLAEDDEGNVDTLYRDLEFNARQAELMFGKENLSAKLREILDTDDKAKQDEKHPFIHAIYPRDPAKIDPSKLDPANMPIASCHVEVKTKHICRESGYKESPFMATRFLKWGKSVYGYSPSWLALPEARQLNFLEMQMDALAEIAAFPRMLLPSSHEGEIDIRAGGVTYYDSANPSAIPKEWATAGRYDVGEARAKVKRDAIEQAFHVDLFQMFQRTDKQMTAREVGERSSEKLTQFSPTFARMTTELYGPFLRRVFLILLRAGLFPQPPASAIMQDQGGAYLPEPKVSYSSRIALAIKSQENSAFYRFIEGLGPLIQLRPDILDHLDMERIPRDLARNDGISADWLLPLDKVREAQAARAQQAQQQQQIEQTERMAGAVGKAGAVRPESVVGQAIEGAM